MNIMDALRQVTSSIKSWTDENKVQKVNGKGLSTNDYTNLDRQKVEGMPNDLVILDGKLFLAQDGAPLTESAVTLPSGGGGGSSSASVTLKNLLPSNTITVAYGSSANLVFEYSSSEAETASGIAYIYLSDTLKKTCSINPGENTIDIGDIIGSGANNIKLTVSDIYSNSKSLSFVVNAISLKLSSTFDDSQIFSGDITVKYVPTGAIFKDLHMILDDTDTIVDSTSETGKQRTFIINQDKLYHGAHDLILYLSTVVNDVEVVSNKLYYSIIFAEEGATTPIISSVCTIDSITQGEKLQIDYTVYDPTNMETEVSLVVYNNDTIYSETKRTVNATKQAWVTRDLPVGNIFMKIVYGVIERVHHITVLENDINIPIKQTDLDFELKAAGKSNTDNDRDVWENNGVTTVFENINYDSTGWIETDAGTALRLSGDAKATVQFQPFRKDARLSGYTIELVFAIRDVNNRDAVAISCFDGNIGFQVRADTAVFKSEQNEVSCNYTDEEKVHVAFSIESKDEFRLMSVYLNGILSGIKQYPESDNFQSNNPEYITIGSPYCSIDLYAVRSYSTALTASEARDNYIASITDISEKLALIKDNDIYDIYGNLSFDKMKEKIPIVLITGELPQYKGDKKKVSISFTHPDKPLLNYEDTSVTLDVQGTSSQFYPRKNYKLKESSYHMIDTDKIDTKVICIKVDYAESTGCRNIAGANYVHTLYIDSKVPPQEVDDRIRTTIYGYPCAVFHRANTSATPEFISKGNYNYDKGSYEAFGFTSDYPDAFSVEFCNNTSDPCLFHGKISESWGDDFEFRYPDEYEDISDFKRMHDWVVSTWQDGATGNALASIYTGVDGTTYENDTAEYRLAKFKKEFTDYFNLDFALVYYTYGLLGMYVDSFAKNLFLTTFDRQHWYCYYYDLDTSWGINNEGVLQFSYDHLFDDMLGNAFIFNGQSSALWQNFEAAFIDKIKETYKTWRSNGLVTYDKIIEYYITKQTAKYGISVYNEDSEVKYIEMLRTDGDATNLYQVRGDGAEHFKYFTKNRIKFMDSYCYAGDYPDDYVSLRIYTPSGDLAVAPNANITVTPFSGMFCGVKYKANGTLQQQRANAGEFVTFIAPNETFNDTETAVYGASELSSLGDLSPLYPGTVNVSKATKLTEIVIGNATPGYSNTNLRDLSVGTNKLLKKIDVRNCPNLTAPLALSGCPNIEEIYATGSSISSVELPSSGFLKIVHLPGTLTNLTVTNQQYIQDFTLEGYDNLTTLRIEDTVNIPVEDIMLNAPNLNRIRLIDVQWEAESEAALVQTINKFKACLGLDANGNNTDKAVVTGRVHVAERVSDTVVGDVYNNFPDLIVDDGSAEIYILNYKDWDGSILYSYRVAEGASAINPITEGLIEEPFRESDSNYSYEFIGWNNLPTNINRHYQITAQYNTKVAVNFAVDGKIVHSEYAIYGQSVEDPVANGTISEPTKEGTDDLHYAFNGWDGSLTNITLPRTLNALWANVYPVRFYATESSTTPHYVQWVKSGEDAHDPVAANECAAPDDIVTTNEKKLVFSAWDNIPTNIIEITKVYAQYNTYWAARFLNDEKLYLLEWALNGTDVVEPKDYFTDYVNPTRESTAQYDFTFSKWDGDFAAITEARDYNAVYNNTIRKYTVYFYNDTTLLQKTENVQYGSGASYTGSTPTKLGVDNPEEYVFKGWMPAAENITGDTYCYALFKFTGYLFGKLGKTDGEDYGYGTIDTPNWDTINTYWDTIDSDIVAYKAGTMSEDDFFTKYPIGGRMIFQIALSSGTVTADVEIIGHNHDDLSDGSGKASLTFFVVDLPQIQHRMNPDNVGNQGGWEATEMRTFTNGELLEAFPEKLRAIIKTVNKISDGGVNNLTLVITEDRVWLASYDEVGFINSQFALLGQGTLYGDVFSDKKESRSKYIMDSTSTGGWSLRSSYTGDTGSTLFVQVTKPGNSYGWFPASPLYVAFGFSM